MNAPVKLDTLPEWNLADLYAGREDPKIEADLAAAKAANDELVKLKGRFTALAKRHISLALGADCRRGYRGSGSGH